jgi:hypothetical protein
VIRVVYCCGFNQDHFLLAGCHADGRDSNSTRGVFIELTMLTSGLPDTASGEAAQCIETTRVCKLHMFSRER